MAKAYAPFFTTLPGKMTGTLATLALTLVTGCAVGPVYQRPNLNLPSAHAVQVADMVDAVSAELGWWDIVNDDVVLKSLVIEAIERNFDLRSAISRVKQAREQAAINGLEPTLRANASSGRSGTSYKAGPSMDSNSFSTGLSASWEIDLWGKLRHGRERDLANYLATEQGRRSVFLTLIGDVVSGYYKLRSLDMQLATSKRTIESRKASLALMQKKFEFGAIEKIELNQAVSALVQTEATVPQLELSLHQQENALSLLLGRGPGAIARGKELRAVPPKSIAPGMPSELLERRPDIRQKEESLKAACASVGVATANLFPSFSLTGSLGLSSNKLADLVNTRSFSLMGGLSAPIFDGGALRHQRNATMESWEQARIDYEKTVTSALCDVSNALMGLAKSKEIVKAQEKILTTLRESERLVAKRYEFGGYSYLEVIDAQRNLFSAEQSFANALCDQQTTVIKLYLALGGGWKQADKPAKAAGNS